VVTEKKQFYLALKWLSIVSQIFNSAIVSQVYFKMSAKIIGVNTGKAFKYGKRLKL
jgi:hypothetical protein